MVKQDGVVLQKYTCTSSRDAITTNYNRELERSVLWNQLNVAEELAAIYIEINKQIIVFLQIFK